MNTEFYVKHNFLDWWFEKRIILGDKNDKVCRSKNRKLWLFGIHLIWLIIYFEEQYQISKIYI